MNSGLEAIRKLVEDKIVLYAIATDIEGRGWEELGDKTTLPYSGIILGYFPGPEAMPNLAAFLEGQILPKTICQGKVACVICKPTAQDIAGLFLCHDGDVIQRLALAKELNAKIAGDYLKPTV